MPVAAACSHNKKQRQHIHISHVVTCTCAHVNSEHATNRLSITRALVLGKMWEFGMYGMIQNSVMMTPRYIYI